MRRNIGHEFNEILGILLDYFEKLFEKISNKTHIKLKHRVVNLLFLAGILLYLKFYPEKILQFSSIFLVLALLIFFYDNDWIVVGLFNWLRILISSKKKKEQFLYKVRDNSIDDLQKFLNKNISEWKESELNKLIMSHLGDFKQTYRYFIDTQKINIITIEKLLFEDKPKRFISSYDKAKIILSYRDSLNETLVKKIYDSYKRDRIITSALFIVNKENFKGKSKWLWFFKSLVGLIQLTRNLVLLFVISIPLTFITVYNLGLNGEQMLFFGFFIFGVIIFVYGYSAFMLRKIIFHIIHRKICKRIIMFFKVVNSP